jgi:hypothetical protein
MSMEVFSCQGPICPGSLEVPGWANGPVGAQRACNFLRGCISTMITNGTITENNAAGLVIQYQQEYESEIAQEVTGNA